MSLSVLFQRGEGGDSTRLLVEIPRGRFELSSRQDASGRVTFESIRSLEHAEVFERSLYLPGAMDPPGCSRKTVADACIEFRGKNGKKTVLISEFSGAKSETARAALRALVTPEFAEALKILVKEFPRSPEFDRYGDDFVSLVWPGLVKRRGKSPLEKSERRPGCAFDASFGSPCSAEELQRESLRFSPR